MLAPKVSVLTSNRGSFFFFSLFLLFLFYIGVFVLLIFPLCEFVFRWNVVFLTAVDDEVPES